jgi:hypothetical protein
MKLFNALSATERNDLAKVKAAMSKKYIAADEDVRAGTNIFQALASSRPIHNVVGVGIDEKYVDGIPTGVSSVTFLVKNKLPLSAIAKKDLLPKTVDGFPTDVEEVGAIVAQAKKKKQVAAAAVGAPMPNPQTRMRPAQPGASIGFADPENSFVMAGTFGLVVKDDAGTLYILSNNHVLAYESGVDADGVTKRVGLPVGAPIFQPGLLDGGNANNDQIATLSRWVDLRADRNDNLEDGALAELSPQNVASTSILFVGPPQGTTTAAKDMMVHKFGRTTSYRAGRVSSVTFDLAIDYKVGSVAFENQIAIRGLNGQHFSDAGDSGSAILERGTNKVVGLLFAGATNGSMTFANHIADVFTQLKIKLA